VWTCVTSEGVSGDYFYLLLESLYVFYTSVSQKVSENMYI
jgi:hypothetical protein